MDRGAAERRSPIGGRTCTQDGAPRADAFRLSRAKVPPDAWRRLYRQYAGHWPRVVLRRQVGMGAFDLLATPTPEDALRRPGGAERYDWVTIADGIDAGYLTTHAHVSEEEANRT